MKQTDSDKMDLLLRSLVRREGSPSVLPGSTVEDQSHTEHLDADELSCYAERALPDATRARYTAHLADCSSCRKIVTELTLAAGADVLTGRIRQTPSPRFWERFGAFFSPPVLRYAIPAVALFAVIAVAFIAFRQGQQAVFVAQNQQSPSLSVADNKGTSSQVEPPADNSEAAILKKQAGEPRTIAVTNEDKRTKTAEKGEVAQPGVTANSVSLGAAKDAPTSRAAAEAAAQPSFAPEPAPAAPPKEQSKTVDARPVDELRQQEQVAERDAAVGRREDQARANDKSEQNAAAPQSQDATLARRRVKGLTVQGQSAGAKSSDDREEEVRNVGGRRFRRQGQTWVDTAYDASRSAIGVARGSEQYRALIADEPGIRTVAEQLQGEVILVWKGRTYRIR